MEVWLIRWIILPRKVVQKKENRSRKVDGSFDGKMKGYCGWLALGHLRVLVEARAIYKREW